MRKSTLGYIALTSLIVNTVALMVVAMMKQWGFVILHSAIIYACVLWFQIHYFDESDRLEKEKNDAVHRE